MGKRLIVASIVLWIIVMVSGAAWAGDRHSRGGYRSGGYDCWTGNQRGPIHFGLFIGPSAVFYSPPLVYTYPPPRRVWVPGYWDWQWFGYGWERVWIPGYWQWR